jgi:hypothetical protein
MTKQFTRSILEKEEGNKLQEELNNLLKKYSADIVASPFIDVEGKIGVKVELYKLIEKENGGAEDNTSSTTEKSS